jgi:hypothetical protein
VEGHSQVFGNHGKPCSRLGSEKGDGREEEIGGGLTQMLVNHRNESYCHFFETQNFIVMSW